MHATVNQNWYYGGEEWHRSSDLYPLSDFQPKADGRRKFYKLHAPLEQIVAEGIAGLAKPPVEEDEDTQTTALVYTGDGTAKMKLLKSHLEEQVRKTEVLRLVMQKRLQQMCGIANHVHKQLKYINRVVGMIETYLGVYEEVVQIQAGQPAPVSEPITIRQSVLYMDEEVGDVEIHYDPTTGSPVTGIDFNRVENFDAWLLADGVRTLSGAKPRSDPIGQDRTNLDRILPEAKGMVAIQPSRQRREYSADWLLDGQLNSQNKFVYLLLRNGENVYRIWTGLTIEDRLFPSAEEFGELMEEMQDEDREWRLMDLREQEMDHKQYALLLQGIIERTPAFQPLPGPVSLFDPATFEAGFVRLVRDAEARLSDGHIPYHQWQADLNRKIKRGSRIYLGPLGMSRDDSSDRLPRLFRHTVWSRPEPGIYTVEEAVFKKNSYFSSRETWHWKILFQANDETYNPDDGYHNRAARVSFELHEGDSFVLNYDDLTLEDVNYWMSNRLERPNYLRVLPLLKRLRIELEKEIALEAAFVKLIANELGCEEAQVWEAVRWWKMKVVAHRPISQDDAKAWRMIRRRITKELHQDAPATAQADK